MHRSVRSATGNTGRIFSLADYLSSKTHFTTDECKAMLVMFERMCPSGKLDRHGLREFLSGCFDITNDVMLDLLYKSFDESSHGIEEVDFVMALSRMLRGTPEELIDFCFRCFDINGDNLILREELQQCLRGCIVPGYGVDYEEIEDAEKEILEICLRKLDLNGDGQVTKEEFREAVLRDPLLIQAVGPCLPTPSSMAAFLSTITDDYRSYAEILTVTGRGPESKNSSYKSRATIKSFLLEDQEQDLRPRHKTYKDLTL